MPRAGRLVVLFALLALALPALAQAAPDPGRWERVGFLPRPESIAGGSSTVPEIVDVSPDGRTLVSTLGEAGFAWIDLTDPTAPKLLERQTPGGHITSVNVTPDGKYLLVTAKSALGTGSYLAAYDMATHARLRSFAIPDGPDGVAISPDGRYAVIAIENETDRSTPGSLVIFTLDGPPATWAREQVPVVLDPSFAAYRDPQPEFVDIAADNVAIVSLQENNGYALLDVAHARITKTFSAGETDQLTLDDGTAFDVPFTAPREPDEVVWTRDGQHALAANEGEGGDGGRSISVLDRTGATVWDSGNAFDKALAERGQYPIGRSKGSEPEGADAGTIAGVDWAIVGAERGNAVEFYDITDPVAPVLRQSVSSGGPEPEGVLMVPQRRLAISPDADAGAGGWSIYQLRPRGSDPGPHRQVRIPGAAFHGTQSIGTGVDGGFAFLTGDYVMRVGTVDAGDGADLGEARGDALYTLTADGQPLDASGVSHDIAADPLTGGFWAIRGGQPGTLWRVSRTGVATPVALPDPPDVWVIYGAVVVSPDGGTVYVVAWELDRQTYRPRPTSRIYALDVATGAVRTLKRAGNDETPEDAALTPDGDLLVLDSPEIADEDGSAGRLHLFHVAGVPDGTTVAATDAGRLPRVAGERLQPRMTLDAQGRLWTLARRGELSDSGLRFPRTAVEPGAATGLPAPAPIGTLAGLRPDFQLDTATRGGDRLFVTGPNAFGGRGNWGRAQSGAALFSAGAGVPLGGAPAIDGSVVASAPDGVGGFYIGGAFTAGERSNLAHLKADGSVDAAFAPSVAGTVTALTVDGGRVYAAGAWGVAAFAAATGTADVPFAGPAVDGAVNALAAGGGKLYLAGAFKTLGGAAHAGLGRLDAATGAVDAAWAPQLAGSFGDASNLALGEAGVYVGGRFTNISGVARPGVALVGDAGAVVPAFAPSFRGNTATRVGGMVLAGGRLYLAANNNLAAWPDTTQRLSALDPVTGAVDPGFTPPLGLTTSTQPGATPLAYADGQLYVRSVGGDLAVSRVDARTGRWDARWRPSVVGEGGGEGTISTLAAGRGAALIGGTFAVAGVERGLAAIDLTTGRMDPTFNPGDVFSTIVAAAGGWLYYVQDGTVRRLDGRTGVRDPGFALDVVGGVNRLVAAGGRVYVVGALAFAGGEPVDGVAALDAATGALDPGFRPRIDGAVTRLVARGDAVWLAGSFTHVGGDARPGLARVSAATGAPDAAFAPPAVDGIAQLAISGNRLYVAGSAGPAALDATSGARDPAFAPKLTQSGALLVHGGRLLVAGARIDNDPSVDGLAALDLVTGAVDQAFLPQLPGFSESVALAAYGSRLLSVGGGGYFEIGDEALLTFDVAKPVSATPPAVTGTARVGERVTCAPGTWSNSPVSFLVTWLRDGVAAGTGAQRVPAAEDAGRSLACSVVAVNDAGESAAVVSAAVTVAAAPVVDEPEPEPSVQPTPTPVSVPAPTPTPVSPKGNPVERGVTAIRSAQRKGSSLVVVLGCRPDGCAGKLTVSWRARGRTTKLTATASRSKVTIKLSSARRRALAGVRKVTVSAGGVRRTLTLR
ncbi:hypothetical protein [Solirubrobacter soli]|uniref:hypothetical protein n=1 Tax=Solirubrobacter soli TaxID=363832 RepID=UPI0004166109|nr:hypothetical protein [Solirubrobacter soli]